MSMALVASPDSPSLRRCAGRPKRIAIIGSSGSIGSAALSVLREHREHFDLRLLSTGKNVASLMGAAKEFSPRYIHIADSSLRSQLSGAEVLDDQALHHILASGEIDLVLAAVVGFDGLPSVIAALEGGCTVALANKESLVSAGELVTRLVSERGGALIPVDSEHSALFQVLQGERVADIAQLVLTASGGPFFGFSRDRLRSVTPEQALRHPTWTMGSKITIDSASMVNKALEVAEAFWLFGIPASDIDIVVHPESIVHSLIRWNDGSAIAQLGVPDMRIPIAFALRYPDGRLNNIAQPLDLTRLKSLNFYPLDADVFKAPELMRNCLATGGVAAAVYTIANDIAVERFLSKRLRFDQIIMTIEEALERFGTGSYSGLSDLLSLRDRMYAEIASFIAG